MPDIDSLSGRALDAAVAEKVMGEDSLPAAFSTSPIAAMKVVERMREMGWDFRAHGPMSDKWQAFFTLADESDDAHMEGDTFPTSVCRAALMAMEAKRV